MNQNTFNALGVLCLSIAIGMGLFIEFFCGQPPCFLCFLQRASMFMIALGLYWNLRYGIQVKHYAFSFLSSILGLSAALKHMSLNICKPLQETTFFFCFYRVYTWSFLVFFASLLSLSFLLLFYRPIPVPSQGLQKTVGGIIAGLLIVCTFSILYRKGFAI